MAPTAQTSGFLGLRQRSAMPTDSVRNSLEEGGEDRHKSVGDMARFFKDLRTAPDRGRSYVQEERHRQHLASLVEAGRHAGRSRVEYVGRNIQYHLLTKDFFITAINLKTWKIISWVSLVYLFVFFFFSIWWWLIVRFYPGCVYGATTYVESFTFAVVTHMTIGYGNTGPQQCWAAAWLIAIQIIVALLLESIVIGIVFARISHPKQRSRSIFISDTSVIARRDGILKFMFRVADIRRTQVVDPKIKAFMYTWGEGRVTAEGERIPVRCEPLDIGYIDGMLLLPLIIEHTIDERSPLCGHTHDSLMALNAEVVVTFEGTTEFGNPFMARRSYLPSEIRWGHQFAQIIIKPVAEAEDTRYQIDLNKFHDVLPQDGLPLLNPSQLSQLVVNRAKRTVPYPLLGENTLVLSDVLVVAPNERGQPCLMCRAADTYPNQMLEITARMYLYRWYRSTEAGQATFTQHALECGYRTGEDRLYLRLPVELSHPITERSPIANWLRPGGLMEDADSEIVVVINCYLHVTGQNRLRQRTYTVHNHVRYGYQFQNIVKHPADSRDHKPRVRWAHFHDIAPLPEEELGNLPPRDAVGLQPAQSMPSLPAAVYAKLPSIAPESHGALRAQETRQHMWAAGSASQSSMDGRLPPFPPAAAAAGAGRPPEQRKGGGILGNLMRPLRRGSHAAAAATGAVAGAAVGAGARLGGAVIGGGPAYRPSAAEERNDYTVLPIDLSRYCATAGNEGDSIPLGQAPAQDSGRRSPLPAGFGLQLAADGEHEEGQHGEEEGGEERPAGPFLLFPEVASYALTTTDAADSLPHPQALHPTLPGPDRFRFDSNAQENQLRNEYTVMNMDLNRYAAQVGRSDTLPRRQGPRQSGLSTPPGRGDSSQGNSGFATPTGFLAASSPTAAFAATQQQAGDGTSTPRLGGSSGGGVSPGAVAAAVALGAAAGGAAGAAAGLAAGRGGSPGSQEGQQQAQQQQEHLEAQPEEEGEGTDATSTIGAESAGGSRPASALGSRPTSAMGMQQQQPAESEEGGQQQGQQEEEQEEEEEGGRALDSGELAELQQRLRRVTSSRALLEQPPDEEEEEGAGPIHFTKQESWQRERALKNLWAAPDSPPAGGSGGGGGSNLPSPAGSGALSSPGQEGGRPASPGGKPPRSPQQRSPRPADSSGAAGS